MGAVVTVRGSVKQWLDRFMSTIQKEILVIFFGIILCPSRLYCGDWPQWGYDASRNMVSSETDLPSTFKPGTIDKDTEEVSMATTKNIKWVAKLGSQSYGNPVVANGKVLIGTNNESPRNFSHKGDRGVVMCLEESTGKFIWQLVVPKLGAGKVSDWEYLGICSSPLVDADRVYVITNRCEVVCLDLNGLGNGNDGEFQNEANYMVNPGQPPIELSATDADIIWRYDMREELGVFPHNIASSSALLVGDKLYVTTSNGQDWSHVNIPSPKSPCLIVLDKQTGKLLGEENSGIGFRLFHCNWSSPAYGGLGKLGLILFGAGDGFCYAFAPDPVKNDDGLAYLKEIWKYDCNPPEYKSKDGKPIKYPASNGPSEIIATPVFYNNRVYIATGQDPEHGQGVGMLSCIDASKTGDISKTGALWTYKDLHRSISTVAIAEGLVYAADFTGRLHCLDADSGKLYWVHDTESNIWGSPLVADKKVYLGNEDGVLTVFATGKQMKILSTIEMPASIYASPIAANSVLYVATQTHLYAIAKSK